MGRTTPAGKQQIADADHLETKPWLALALPWLRPRRLVAPLTSKASQAYSAGQRCQTEHREVELEHQSAAAPIRGPDRAEQYTHECRGYERRVLSKIGEAERNQLAKDGSYELNIEVANQSVGGRATGRRSKLVTGSPSSRTAAMCQASCNSPV
ncbi:hypothetical protein [Bradyrhizobium sp. CB2312]|uniref:hypothetical protein n=1 Tax=Bradyrhizobium sp. CB2312 TaxID=3039155 RepID=UPI0024B1444C|nr:hypothetical protein [Bradyrhizobium sp. CB2312]WFU74947.1 hypothetical protein QA642_13370 [Bradyrhizobium sp. CB2312]